MTERACPGARRLPRDGIVRGGARPLLLDGIDAPISDEYEEEYRLGYERGYSDGLHSVTAQLEAEASQARAQWESTALEQLEQAIGETRTAQEALAAMTAALRTTLEEDLHWAESAAIEIAYAAVCRLLGDKAVEHSLVEHLCRQARRDIGVPLLRVRVALTDVDAIAEAMSDVEVMADDTLSIGNCILETRRGRFDVGLEARLTLLRDALLATVDDYSAMSNSA